MNDLMEKRRKVYVKPPIPPAPSPAAVEGEHRLPLPVWERERYRNCVFQTDFQMEVSATRRSEMGMTQERLIWRLIRWGRDRSRLGPQPDAEFGPPPAFR